MSMFRFSLAAGLATLVTTALITRAAPPLPGAPIPLESFFSDPEMRSVQLAPDGKHLAFLAKLGTGRIGIALMDLDTGRIEPLVSGRDENYSLYFWKGSDRIVFGGDLGGTERLSLRTIGLAKRKVVELANAFKEVVAENANQAAILDVLKFDPEHILIEGQKGFGTWHAGVYQLDVTSGERLRVYGTDGSFVFDFLADNAGAIRGRRRLSQGNVFFEVREGPTGDYYAISQTPADVAIVAPGLVPQVFNADNKTLYVVTQGPGEPGRLRAYDTAAHRFLPEPDYVLEGEPDGVVLSWDRTQLRGIYYVTDRRHVHWFDPARAQLQTAIDAALPDAENTIVSSSQDERVSVIASHSDRNPGTYYVLDLRNPARGRPAIMMVPGGHVNSKLSPDQLQPMRPISYAARDGLTIHGYLTLPAGAEGKPLPLIVHPHGGPYGPRDEWGFDPEVQFLASRGYAVLQPNFRGSGGYGVDFLLAGRREWGGKMQDDLTDGVKWAIAQGIADPARVAIVGASYGGYAALAGVTFTPELYCCAVNYVGVSDLSIIAGYGIGNGRGHYGDERFFEKSWVGDDPAYMRARSPVNFVQNIRVPTLHAYGRNDPRVDFDHWKRLKAELDKYHKPYEIVIEGEEGHGFRHENSRVSFYRRVEAFLAEHLPAGAR